MRYVSNVLIQYFKLKICIVHQQLHYPFFKVRDFKCFSPCSHNLEEHNELLLVGIIILVTKR